MPDPRRLKAIQVAGLVTGAVLLALIVSAYLVLDRPKRSRPHPGGLFALSTEGRLYRRVRPPGSAPDAFGFVTTGFLIPWDAVSIWLPRGSSVAHVRMISVMPGHDTGPDIISPVETFTLSKAAYLTAAQKLDALMDSWPDFGERDDCLDGIEVAFRTVPSRARLLWKRQRRLRLSLRRR